MSADTALAAEPPTGGHGASSTYDGFLSTVTVAGPSALKSARDCTALVADGRRIVLRQLRRHGAGVGCGHRPADRRAAHRTH